MKKNSPKSINNMQMRSLVFELLVISIVLVLAFGYIFSEISTSSIGLISGVITIYLGLVFWRIQRYLRCLHQDIDTLSSYLQRLEEFENSIEIRDNHEGALSILKNDIYKLITRLQNTSIAAEEERVHLNSALAEMSHQLKTPLTALQVISDLLKEDLPPAKRAEFLTSMDKQLARLSWIIQSLLKFAKFDAKTMNLANAEIVLADLLFDVQEHLAIILELREQALSITGDERITFRGDSKWISEALINIIKNCSEHSQVGGVISITTQKTPQYVQILISDKGNGIAPQDLLHIFKRFYRGQNASPDSVGIGLAMAKTIVEHQGGYITVESEVDKGTTFNIKFYQ